MEPSVKSLTEMIGDLIVARIPVLDKENKIVVRSHNVEPSGIWVQRVTLSIVDARRI